MCVTGISIILLFILGACSTRPGLKIVRVETDAVQPALPAWPELRLEVSQTDLPLQVSSQALAVIDLDARLTVSYVMNRMYPTLEGDLRGAMLLMGAYGSL